MGMIAGSFSVTTFVRSRGLRTTIDANLTSAFFTLKTLPAADVLRPPRLRGSDFILRGPTGKRRLSRVFGHQGWPAIFDAAGGGRGRSAGVRINAVAPSSDVTERLAAQLSSVLDQIAAGFPLKRLGQVEDVAAAFVFLLSDAASWITGATLDVAGGRVMV